MTGADPLIRRPVSPSTITRWLAAAKALTPFEFGSIAIRRLLSGVASVERYKIVRSSAAKKN